MMNKILFSICLLSFVFSLCNAQSYIFKKDKTILNANILEVGVDIIKFKKVELPNGPTYEILKSDVIKIQYSNGYVDTFIMQSNTDSVNQIIEKKFLDTIHYSEIYILFNDGQDLSQQFPIYLNGKYLCTIKNHMRITYKLYSTGFLLIERKHKKKIGPGTQLIIESGKKYGVRIGEPYPQGLDPRKRFTIEGIYGKREVEMFLRDEFYGFKPFKDEEMFLEEDIENPIIR